MLKERLQKELTDSLKSGDQAKRLVLGMLMTAIKNKEFIKRQNLAKTTSDATELAKLSQLNDDETTAVITSEVKKRREAIEQYESGGRPELAQKEKSEMEILAVYLPEQMNKKEIEAEVRNTIKELGASDMKDMGKVIGAVMSKLKGKTDGGTVGKIVKELLSA